VPLADDRRLFEFLILEGAQAGLSWLTILRKRTYYRRAFADFDPALVASFGEPEIQRLMGDAGIVRNRLKIESAVSNARAYLELQARHGSFAQWLWGHVDGRPVINRWRCLEEVPAETEGSQQLSRELKQAGFRFIGPTIVYAFMQAVGLVNDHLLSCARHAECASMRPDFD
jgi:DNA-3-methyladenine glycosylase I